jgi:hypothetical protein
MLVSKMQIAVVKADTPLYAPEGTSAAVLATQAAAHNKRIITSVVYASVLGVHGK